MNDNETTVAFESSARASRICWELLQLPEAARQQQMIEKCKGDELLLEEVKQRMYRSAPKGFFELPEKARLQPGDRLGNYRIERIIQIGGMGEVFKAERVEPFKMTVAIKIIKSGLVDPNILERFDEERQILADLDHPNIAKIYGGGLTPDDQPYYVMQYVDGQPLDVYCREKCLSVRERVKLFFGIMSAVDYAHRNFIVHRDLKPANILVTEDGRPVLLDFGIAKAMDKAKEKAQEKAQEKAREKTQGPGSDVRAAVAGHNDETGGFIGTFLYASPEQVKGKRISTASDVYSLGVLLYECLSGHLPNDSRSLLHRLAIGDQELVPPSAAIDRDAKRVEEICTERQSKNPEALKRSLRGDLDAIVLKALQTQPEARYATIEQLSGDLERYLTRRVVMARERTFTYVCQKFIERNKIAVGVIFLVLALGAAFAGITRHYENEQSEMRSLIQKIIYADPSQLDAEKLRQSLEASGDEAWLASFLHQTGIDLEDDGHLSSATRLYEQSLAMKQRLFGKDHLNLIPTITYLAGVMAKTGRYQESENLYQRSLDLRLMHYGEGSLELSRGQLNLAVLYQDMNRLEEAGQLLESSYQIREGLGDRGGMAAAQNALAWQRYLEGQYDEAEKLYLEVLEAMADTRSSLRVERTARVHRNMALVYQAQGRLELAEEHALKAWHSFRERHLYWRVADAESVLGAIRLDQDRLEEARLLLEESYPIIESVKGKNARQTREALERLDEGRRQFSASRLAPETD